MANTKKYVSLDKLGLYDGKIKAFIAAADTDTLNSAKGYADGLADNYEAAGNVATGVAEAKSYTDTEVAKANDAAAAAKTQADKGVADAAAAKAAADAAQGEVDALEAYVGTFTASEGVDTVVKYIDAKTANIASDETVSALDARVVQAEKDIDAIEADYLKSGDKNELVGKINAKADQTALDSVSAVANAAVKQSDYNTKVAALEAEDERIAGLVSAEAERAAGVESGLEGRLEEVEAFFKLAEGEQLDTALDTLKEIQTYLGTEGAAADKMVEDIAANKKDIENMDAAYKAADQTLQGNIDKKADASALEGLTGRVGELETASANHALKTEVEAVSDALTEYKDAHAGDYTNAQIDAAIKVVADDVAALNDTYATDAELTQAIADAKTDASNKDAVVLAEAQKGITAVQTAVDTHTGNGDIHVTAEQKTQWSEAYTKRHEHSNLSTLEGITAQKITEWDTVSSKATATALNDEIARAKAAEEANAAAIAAFVEVSEEEVLALFN